MSNDPLEAFRAQFPVCGQHAYLNNAGVAPTSLGVRDAVNRWLDDLVAHGLHHEADWEDVAGGIRERAARLIGAGPHEVAFVRNTSHGLGLVAEGLPWQPGDEVAALTELEYPSNIYPWLHLADRGVTVRPIAPERGGVTPAGVERALTPATRLVSISAVQFATGHRTDLAAIGQLCRERNVLLCVDGIQQVGAFELDVKELGIHFLSADSHKWMLGLCGVGILFVDEAVIDRVRPVLVGWKSTKDPWNFEQPSFELREDAQKFEEGSPAYALIYGMGAALELIDALGVRNIEGHVRGLLSHLEERATARGWAVGPSPEERAGILIIHPPGDASELAADLARQGVSVSVRSGGLRISPHAFNNTGDIDRLVEVLAALTT